MDVLLFLSGAPSFFMGNLLSPYKMSAIFFINFILVSIILSLFLAHLSIYIKKSWKIFFTRFTYRYNK
jgi:predicted transporter